MPKANPTYVNDEFASGKEKMPPLEKPKARKTAVGQNKDPRWQKVEGPQRECWTC
jgi:hypothetical protein